MIEIFIITYNRSRFLKNTLHYIKDTKLKNLKITVLNNCSTDDTVNVFFEFFNVFKYEFKELDLVTHEFNVGPNVNFLKAIELSRSEYTWVLCDDDFIDASDIDDVFEILNNGEVDLVHVGAHPEKERKFFGVKDNISNLLQKGYPYFAYSSFMPCNIFRTKMFQNEFLIKGYNNVVNSYPHMPYLFDVFKKNKEIYISKKQIITAGMGGHSYNELEWTIWWINTCKLLQANEAVRLAFFDQFKIMANLYNPNYMDDVNNFLFRIMKKDVGVKNVVQDFIDEFFTKKEKRDLIKIKLINKFKF